MSIIARIHSKYDDFTKIEQKIADYIANRTGDVAFKTLDALAADIGVSTTSIIRFARRLGYLGYTQMQQDIQSNLVEKMSLPERYERASTNIKKNQLLRDMLDHEIEALKKSVELIDLTMLDDAVKSISNAKVVYVLGARSTYGLAHNMYANLSQAREGVRLLSGVGAVYPEEISCCGPEDVCIAYLFPRYQKIVSSLLATMRARGVKVILITNQPYSPIEHLGDIILCCTLQHGIMTKDSLIPPMFLNNYLFTCVMAEDYEKTKARLETMESILSEGYYFSI